MASSRLAPLRSKAANDTGVEVERLVLSSRRSVSPVAFQVPLTVRLSDTSRAASLVSNVPPVETLAPLGNRKLPPCSSTTPCAAIMRLSVVKVPPVKVSVPGPTVTPPCKARSADPPSSCSVSLSNTIGAATVNPGRELSSVSAKSARLSVPSTRGALFVPRVVSSVSVSVLVLSGTTPLRLSVPSTSRVLPERARVFPLVEKFVSPVARRVESVSVRSSCKFSVVPGNSNRVPVEAVPPALSVRVPPLESSLAPLLRVSAPERVRLPLSVLSVRLSSTNGSANSKCVVPEPKLSDCSLRFTPWKVTGALVVRAVGSSKLRMEVSLLVNVPVLRSRVSDTETVLPLTSKLPSAPKATPSANVSVPPVEVSAPASSCKGLSSVRSAFPVSSCEPAFSITSEFGSVKPLLPSPSWSACPLSASAPSVKGDVLETSVSPSSVSRVALSVTKLAHSTVAPCDSMVPPERSSAWSLSWKEVVSSSTSVPETANWSCNSSRAPPMSSRPVPVTLPPEFRRRVALSLSSDSLSAIDRLSRTISSVTVVAKLRAWPLSRKSGRSNTPLRANVASPCNPKAEVLSNWNSPEPSDRSPVNWSAVALRASERLSALAPPPKIRVPLLTRRMLLAVSGWAKFSVPCLSASSPSSNGAVPETLRLRFSALSAWPLSWRDVVAKVALSLLESSAGECRASVVALSEVRPSSD